MIKKTTIVTTPCLEEDEQDTCYGVAEHYLWIEFTDGTFVTFDEEELKNAAILAQRGALHD